MTRGFSRRAALGTLLAALLTTGALTTVPTSSSAQPEPAPAPSAGQTTIAPAEPLLEDPRRGEQALRELGDDLPVAADRNDLPVTELRELLRSDETVWVDTEGLLFYVDPVPGTAAEPGPVAAPSAPLADTFALHSNPGASLTILLDFDGAYVAGTAWNASGVAAANHPAWDPAGDGPAFSSEERAKVQQIWAIVAEDYAPFDVDVTTQDPGTDRLIRSSSTDSEYGTRVLVTPSNDPFTVICSKKCGGVAYLGVFDRVGVEAQPAWVFPQALGDSAKSIAEAATHEAGHNLGLDHDGTATQGYYAGHGVWAPIMGTGYGRPLVQWSAGSYTGANNGEDDLAVLKGFLGARADEASGSVSTPSPLPDGEARIGTRSDIDAYLLGGCSAGSTVQVRPAAVAPNLDVRAVLHDASGVQRAVSQPPVGLGDGTTATGLGASVSVPVAGEGWVLSVEGVGEGTWGAAGYDDYASLGAYTVQAPGCDGGPVDGAPDAPAGVAPGSVGRTEITLTWAEPAAEGSGPVTGYVVSRSGTTAVQNLSSSARSHTFTDLAPSTSYQLSVRAVNETGAGATATISATTADPPPAAPSPPRNLAGTHDRLTGRIDATWTEPESAGSGPVTGYDVFLDGSYVGQLEPTARGVLISRDGGFTAGEHVVGVAAVSAVGTSLVATTSVTVNGLPLTPRSVSAIRGDASATVTWTAPRANGSAVTRYTVRSSTGATAVVGATASSLRVTGLKNGTVHRFTVSASNAEGEGERSAEVAVTPAGRPGTPSRPSAKAGTRKATITWKAPSSNGTAITAYRVRRSDGTVRTVKASARSYTWTSLKKGRRYSFKVYARNSVGTSNASSSSSTIRIK